MLTNTIVYEGICDCCDGSDEKDSPFQPNCINHCEESLGILRKQALINYRLLQAGIRAKKLNESFLFPISGYEISRVIVNTKFFPSIRVSM